MHCIKVKKPRSKFFVYGYFPETKHDFVILDIPEYNIKVSVKSRDVYFSLHNDTIYILDLSDKPQKPTVRRRKSNHRDLAFSTDNYTAYEMEKKNLSHYWR